MAQGSVQKRLPRSKVPIFRHLYFQVVCAILLGVLVGVAWPHTGAALKPLGDAFVKLIKMIIAPVIFLTIVTGIGHMANMAEVGRVALKVFVYFLVFSTLALIVGLVVGNLVQPGAGMNINPATLDAGAIADYRIKSHDQSIVGFLTNIIPTTPTSALAGGDILQVLFVAILVGAALTMVGAKGKPLLEIFESASAVTFKLVEILMRAAPIGVFGAMAFTIGKYGVASLAGLARLVATFYATSAVFVFVVLGLVARFNRFSILRLVAYLKEELLLVLGTSSSEAALPRLMEKMEEAGCNPTVVGIVVPAGYSFNLDGTNIYMTLATLFIAQATGIHLSIGEQLLLLGVAMISSKGAAGVTGAGFITLAATLSVVPSVPVAGMALILGVDRFMSECRSITNFIGNAVASIVVARWEGELDEERLASALGVRARSKAG